MSYQSGKMGIAECLAMVFVMNFAHVFLTGPSKLMMEHASAAWEATILIGLAAVGVLFIINWLFQIQNGDLLQIAEACLGVPGKWLIGMYYSGIFLLNAILLIRQFAENTLLTGQTTSEFNMSLLLYGLTVGIILYIGVEPICRAAYVIMPFGLAGLFFVLIAVAPYYDANALFPLQGRGLDKLLTQSVLRGGIYLPCLAPALMAATFHDRRGWLTGSLLGLGGSVIMKVLTMVVFTLVFGTAVGQERVLAFYELARMVYLGRFVQRVEALFIVFWIINGLLAIALHIYVAIYLLGRLLDLPSLRPLFSIAIVLAASLSAMPEDISITLELEERAIRTLFNVGLYGIPLLLLALSVWKGKQKAGDAACSGQ